MKHLLLMTMGVVLFWAAMFSFLLLGYYLPDLLTMGV